jgi:hypothetical protein
MARETKIFVRVQPHGKVPGAESWFWQVFLETPAHLEVVAADTLQGSKAEALAAAKKAREAYRTRRSDKSPM